jgi:uncharacterized membrane protein
LAVTQRSGEGPADRRLQTLLGELGQSRQLAEIELGPLDGRHTWTYETVNGGTRVTLELEYKVPGAALGKIADRLIVERMQSRAFQQSLENLKMLCEAEQAE